MLRRKRRKALFMITYICRITWRFIKRKGILDSGVSIKISHRSLKLSFRQRLKWFLKIALNSHIRKKRGINDISLIHTLTKPSMKAWKKDWPVGKQKTPLKAKRQIGLWPNSTLKIMLRQELKAFKITIGDGGTMI